MNPVTEILDSEIVKTLPVTEAQLEIWYGSQLSEEVSCSFNQSVVLNLRGQLDFLRLKESFEWLVKRHEALRATFGPGGELHHVHSSMPVEIPYVDLASLGPEARDDAVRRLLEEEARQPFDLAQGPLFRAGVAKLGDDEHALFITLHHIICDGCSVGILLQDLGSHYSGEPRTQAGDALQSPYSEFVLEQQASLKTPDRAAAEHFWLERFSHPVQPLELPADRLRPTKRQFTGGSAGKFLSSPLTEALKRVSAHQRCTLVTTLLAGYYVLLHRLSGQSEITIGLPMSSRTGAGERLVAHCVNFLPIRHKVHGGMKFTEHLAQLWRTLLDAHQHQNFTLGTLLQKLNHPRERNRMPLASVMFNLDWMQEPVKFQNLQTELKPNPYCQARFDLSLSVAEHDGQLELHAQYSAELFDPETIERWLGHYETLLWAVTTHPEERISELALLTSSEQRQLLVDWSHPHSSALTSVVGTIFTGSSSLPSPDQNQSEECRIYVLDAYLQPCPIGVPGELYISGPKQNNVEADAVPAEEPLLPDPFRFEPGLQLQRTQTRARFLADGQLEFLTEPEDSSTLEQEGPKKETSVQAEQPANATEQTLAGIWREVIGLKDIGRNDNFFDVGGHSLLATQVISRIGKAFKIDLPLRTIFEAPTLAALANAVVQAQSQPGTETPAITRRKQEGQTNNLLERLDQLSDAELQELLQNPELRDVLL